MATHERLVSPRFPYLPLDVVVGGQRASVECLLDTGFDGDLALPLGWFSDAVRPDYLTAWALADGTEIEAPVYVGTARVGTHSAFPGLITALGDEPLVGRGVSDRFMIMLDHGQRLIVEA